MSFVRIQGVFFRYFYVLRKGLMQLSDLFYWPLVDIFLWGLAAVWVATQSANENFPLLLMTGLVLWQIVWRGSVDISASLLQEIWHRNLVNLFSTPLKISEWTLGVILLSLCKLTITISFGSSVVYFLYSVNVFSIGWIFIPYAVLLLIFGWSLGFISGSAIAYWGQPIEMLTWMIGPLFAPFSAVFYPVSILPFWVQKISWALPTTYIFEGMRRILNGHSLPNHYLWMSTGLTLLYFALSVVLFRFVFQKSRVKGLARLE